MAMNPWNPQIPWYTASSPQGDWATLWIHFSNVFTKHFLDAPSNVRAESCIVSQSLHLTTKYTLINFSELYLLEAQETRRKYGLYLQGAHNQHVFLKEDWKCPPFRKDGDLGCGYWVRRSPLWTGFHLSPRVIHQVVDVHSNVRHVFDNIQGAESCKSRHESLWAPEKIKSVK